jgi:tRNA-dihydrouridine synthase
VDRWAAREPAAIKQVDQLLESAALTQHTVMAETLRHNLHHIAQIELMIARAQVSRNNALREIELHRAMLAQKLRRELQQIEDAEYRITDADSTNRNSLS